MQNPTPDPIGDRTPDPVEPAADILGDPAPDPYLDRAPDPFVDPVATPVAEPVGDLPPETVVDATPEPEPKPAARPSALREAELRPLYAVAGLTDLLASKVRTALQENAERASRHRAELEAQQAQDVKAEQAAKRNADELRRLLSVARSRLQELQHQAGATYDELAGRGKRAVDDAVTSARTLTERAERRAEGVRAEVVERIDPAFDVVQDKVTQARSKVTGRDAASHAAQPTVVVDAEDVVVTEPVRPEDVPPTSPEAPAGGQPTSS